MFSLKYVPLEDDLGYIHILVNGNDLFEYVYNENTYYGICRINTLTEWLKNNLRYILSPDPFPVRTGGKTGADM